MLEERQENCIKGIRDIAHKILGEQAYIELKNCDLTKIKEGGGISLNIAMSEIIDYCNEILKINESYYR